MLHGCQWIQSLRNVVSRVAGIRAVGRRGRLHARSHARVHMSRHQFTPHGCRSIQLCRWQKGHAEGVAANAEHAEGGGRQPPTQQGEAAANAEHAEPPTQSTLASIHVHTFMIASVHIALSHDLCRLHVYPLRLSRLFKLPFIASSSTDPSAPPTSLLPPKARAVPLSAAFKMQFYGPTFQGPPTVPERRYPPTSSSRNRSACGRSHAGGVALSLHGGSSVRASTTSRRARRPCSTSWSSVPTPTLQW